MKNVVDVLDLPFQPPDTGGKTKALEKAGCLKQLIPSRT